MDNYDLASGPAPRGNKAPDDLMRSKHIGYSIVQCDECQTIRHEYRDNMTTHGVGCNVPNIWERTVIPYKHTTTYKVAS